MWLQLLYVAVSLYTYWKFFQKKQKYTLEPPTLVNNLPLIGHALMFIGDSKHSWNVIKFLATETLREGGLLIMNFGPKKGYLITDPDDYVTVSQTCLSKDYYYGFAKLWLGEGFLKGPTPEWKKHRKAINPIFAQNVLNGLIGVFNYQARRLVRNWENRKGPFIHSRDVSLNNLESICQNALGIKIEDESIAHDYENALEDILNIMTERFKSVWLHADFIYNWSTLKKKEERAVNVLHDMTDLALKKRKLERMQVKENIDNEGPKTFLDVVIEHTDGNSDYTDKDLREEVDNLIFAGHDTLSSVLVLTLVTIGSYPEVQEKVHKELQEIFGNSDRDLEKNDYSKLRYLDAVIKETIRMYPIVPAIGRKVDTNVKLKNYTMKAGSSCFLLLNGIHQHPLWGPDRNQFKPERWLNPDTLPSNPNMFTGFSFGKRSCIGKTYAMMSMKTTLAHIVRHYKIKSNINNMILQVNTMLKPESGHEISLEKRKTA